MLSLQVKAVSLALLSFSLHVQAEDYNQNITLRFFPDSQQDSCDYSNSSGALTFTTESIPPDGLISHCFSFRDLFTGNATAGFVNLTGNLSPIEWNDGQVGIHWQLFNAEKFDAQANYSRGLYRQHVTRPNSDGYKPGHYADRRVTLYGGDKCSELAADNDTWLNWFGYSCWSEEQGSCGRLPYYINSFRITNGQNEKNRNGQCWVFAELGAATHGYSSAWGVIGAFVSACMAVWLAL